jgi:hypothetical protein
MRTLTKLALTAALAVAFTFHTSFAQCTASLFAGGTGTAASPYQIGTAEQLQNLNQCLGKANQDNIYVLNNDIDLTAYLQGSETGWMPIGNSNASNYFWGKFNGNGHKVSGLWVNMPERNTAVGLFGFAYGEIKDVGVEIDNAKGGVTGGENAAGLAGSNGGTISNSYATGNITTSNDCGGGLVGKNDGGTIRNSYATGNVTAMENGAIGGLVGGNNNSGTISNSYATGNVTAANKGLVGGLVGSNSGTVSNSYAMGNVTLANQGYIGSLVGENRSNSTISNSYATGSVTGSEGVGGLVGNNREGCTVTNGYYDTQTTGQTDTDKGTGKTTAEMKTQSTYAGWDFETIWEINATKNSGYPALRWQTNTTPIRLPQIATGNIRVQSTANAIVLENLPKNAKVELYNLQGKQIYSTHSENSQILKIQVQTKGIYVMKTSNQIMRVVVR